MAYIYKIINIINNNSYIGKTVFSIEKRWEQHLKDSKKERCEKRPLYDAINKYGAKNFIIEIVEECDYEVLNDREIYWINHYNTYKNGYNATLGGDGTIKIDYNDIVAIWNNDTSLTIRQMADYTGHSHDTISRILKEKGIKQEDINERAKQYINKEVSHKVAQISIKTGKIIATYDSQQQAAVALGKQPVCGANIGRVCNGQRASAYGYKWKRI